jgi:hypothetical protein
MSNQQAPMDYLALASEAFNSSTSYFDSSIRPAVESGLKQFQGVHPSGSKYHADAYRSRSRLYRPKTRTTIRKNEAVAAEAMFATADVVAISAEDDSNPEHQASAAVMHPLMQYRLDKSIPWFLTAMGAYQDAQTVGVCISHQYWEYNPQKKIDRPVIELLPVENLRVDPGCNWADPINSSPYVIELIPMYVKDVRARMAEINPKTLQPKWKSMSDTQILAAVRSASDSTRLTRERNRQDSKDSSNAITSFSIVWVHKNIMEIDGEDKVWFTLGTFGLLSEPAPLNTMYFHGRRPYTMGFAVLETHKAYPDGVTGITKDLASEINEVTNQRMDNVKFAMNKRYFAARGAQVDLRSITRNVPGSVTLMNDPEKDVVVHSTPDVTSSSYQEQDRLNLDFDDLAGSFSQGSVQSNRKLNETVGGMNLLSVNANQVSAYQLRTWVETWVEPTLRQLMLLLQYYETDEKILALAGTRAQLQRFGVDEITDEILGQELSLRVNVGVGATNPQEQINNFTKAMGALREILADGTLEKYGLDVAEVIKELFGKLGYKDGSRFFSVEDEDPRLTAAKSTIEQLQQALAAKVSPEMVAKQVAKIDAEIEAMAVKNRDVGASALEKTMRTFFASGQTAQMLASVPALAPLMDALAQAAGYVEPIPGGGTDPNLPQLGAPAAGLVQGPVSNKKTGIEFMPGDGSAPAMAIEGDTSPTTPAAPESAMAGVNGGIETMRSDS